MLTLFRLFDSELKSFPAFFATLYVKQILMVFLMLKFPMKNTLLYFELVKLTILI